MAKTDVSETTVVGTLHADLPITTEATTSRTAVSNDAVRVVSFAMDAGQELTDHSAPRPVVVQVVEGDLAFTVAGQRHELTAGDVVYLAPNERHAVLALTPCRFVLVLATAA
ncbi:MAG TPA: cupin domain-containing protein [Actinomycetes bacterium]|nr:cupin domain-containing protein [Actinomycetes bacterium]